MFSFYRLKYSKIPIWENTRRIRLLKNFRNLVRHYYPVPSSSTSGIAVEVLTSNPRKEELRESINRQLPEAQWVIFLANVSTAGFVFPSIYGPARRFNHVEHLFAPEADPEITIDFIDRAIGTCEADQPRSRLRTFWPLFWIARLIEWLSELPLWLLSLFGLDQERMTRSAFGRLVKGLSQVVLYCIAVVQGVEALQTLFGSSGWGTFLIHYFWRSQ